MKFEYRPYHHSISDEEMLSDVKRVLAEIGADSLSAKEYDKRGAYSSSAVSRRFGGWNVAMRKLGVRLKNEFHDRESLFENLERVWIKKGRQPSRQDMNNKELSLISSGSYLRMFGRWSEALKQFVTFVNGSDTDSLDVSELAFISKRTSPRDVNLRLRFLVMKRDRFTCCACGASPAKDPLVVLQVDHIVPWAKGGRTEMSNLQTLCSKCNEGKSSL